MAKKAKTPTPPRGQGPKRREDTGGFGSLPTWALAVVGVIVAGAIVVGAFVLTGGESESSGSNGDAPTGLTAVMQRAGCTIREVDPIPPQKDKTDYHQDVPSLDSDVEWSTDPPSAGAHYGLWAVWNFYREPVNPRLVAHNLEHGAVAIWWGEDVPEKTVDAIESFYRESPDGMIGTPYPSLGKKIALTSWTGDNNRYYRSGYFGEGHIAICDDFDREAFAAFRDEYRGKGPEGVPMSFNRQGTGP